MGFKLHLSNSDQQSEAPKLGAGDLWVRGGDAPVVAGASPDSTPVGLSVYLQTPGQEQALFPGGSLVGKVNTAVIEPFFALSHYASGYTLADIKAANPGAKILAYVNGAIARDVAPLLGPFQTTLDKQTCVSRGWLVKAQNESLWRGAHAKKLQDLDGKYADDPMALRSKYVAYDDYPGHFLTRIDLPEYREAFIQFVRGILTTPSKSIYGAPDAYFDGVFLDDSNMSPQHGLDLDTTGGASGNSMAPGPFGPWTSNDAYGRDMVEFIDTVSRGLRQRAEGTPPQVMCNLGASPWFEPQRKLALDLASRRSGGQPPITRVAREFTTAWYGASGRIHAYSVQQIILFAEDMAHYGVVMDFADQGKPPANPVAGPTPAERNEWEKQQRQLSAVCLMAQSAQNPVAPTAQPVTIHEGRNNWDSTQYKESMGAPVATLTDPLTEKLRDGMRAECYSRGPLVRDGDVLYRRIASGTVYANFSDVDAVVHGVRIPARDAVLR